MSRIISVIQFSGRVGSVVGVTTPAGRFHLRRYQPIVANPRTPAQMRHRAKLRLASQWVAMLGPVGRTALVANGYGPTDRGKLVSRLMQHVIVNDEGTEATMPCNLKLVDAPSYPCPLTLTLASEGPTFVACFGGTARGDVIAKCIIVHDITKNTWRHTSVLDSETTLSIDKSACESGDAIEVFAYGIALKPKASRKSKNDSPAYAFSPSVAAALNVAGSGGNGGTTPGGGDGEGGEDVG